MDLLQCYLETTTLFPTRNTYFFKKIPELVKNNVNSKHFDKILSRLWLSITNEVPRRRPIEDGCFRIRYSVISHTMSYLI